MHKSIILLLLACFSYHLSWGSTDNRKTYVQKYKNIAIQEMNRTGIPASIKLAQGILESGCGNSFLSVKGNNHFGIKCHDWTGQVVYMNDDSPNECFRKYKKPEESWIDHSEFLTSRPRYAALFKLAPTDYRGWAHGLKQAGYATNPRYAELLIGIIEDEHLYVYDQKEIKELKESKELKELSFSAKKRALTYVNNIPCIQTEQGDSFKSIAQNFDVPLRKLLKYNDKREISILLGMNVFLKKKKNNAAKGYDFHKTKEGETLYLISQQYGIKLSRLVKYNHMEVTVKPQTGEWIALRGKKLF